jgi:hypothetical protein
MIRRVSNMSNPNECYFNGGMWDGKWLNVEPHVLQMFARRTLYTEKKVKVHRYERVDAKEMQFKEETFEVMPATKYIPRNELVIVRVEVVDTTKTGIAIPQSSLEGKKYIVEAVGPKVEDLLVGDQVLINGTKGEEWNYIPGCNDLIVTHQQFISLKIVGE